MSKLFDPRRVTSTTELPALVTGISRWPEWGGSQPSAQLTSLTVIDEGLLDVEAVPALSAIVTTPAAAATTAMTPIRKMRVIWCVFALTTCHPGGPSHFGN